ncbi:hypothetical protein FQR65_LT00657 [Abscondita terminalis]|nr:hypothetical protein FQR65_LT00657 [Abscondita terminalis]
MSALHSRRVVNAIVKTYHDFAENTSIHGLRYTVEEKSSSCEKVAWVLIVFMGVVGSLFMLNLFWNRFESTPTRSTIVDQYAPVSDSPFPSVTICPNRALISNKFTAFVSTLTKLTEEMIEFFETSKFNKTDVVNLLMSNGHNDVVSILNVVSQTCDEMLSNCLWNNEKQNCGEIFKNVSSSRGNCCVYNYQPKTFLRTYSFGLFTGLSVTIDPMVKQRYTSVSKYFGVKISVNHPYNYLFVGDLSKIVPPGRQVLFQLSSTHYTCSNDVHKLTIQQRNCVFLDEVHLNFFPKYSKENCIAECYVKNYLRNCNCIPHYYGLKSISNINIEPKNQFLIIIVGEVRLWEKNQYSCDSCQPQCETVNYNLLATSTVLVPELTSVEENKNIEELIYLNVYFTGTEETVLLRDTTTSVLYLLSSFGGIFSLFLGCSFISGLEILYCVFVRFFINLRSFNEVAQKPKLKFESNLKLTQFAYHGAHGNDKVFSIYRNTYLE